MNKYDFKTGDKVIYTTGGWSSLTVVETVERITPSGLVKVRGRLFYNNGSVRGDGYARIKPWTQEDQDVIDRNERILKAKRKIAAILDSEVSIELANKILEL